MWVTERKKDTRAPSLPSQEDRAEMRGEFSFRMAFRTPPVGIFVLCDLRASARDLILD